MSDRDSTISQLGSSIKNSPSSISRRSFQQERELLLSASDTSHDDSWKYGSQNAPSSSPQVSSNRRRLKPSKKCLEITAFVLVGVVIVTIMFLPITIIHFTLDHQQSNPMNCNEKTWATLNNSCVAPVKYTGVCLEQLKHLRMCATNRTINDDVFVNVSNLAVVEFMAKFFFHEIVPNISNNCKQAAVPLVCLHWFPLCNDNTSHGNLLVSSQEECINIAQNKCRSEWQVAQINGYGDLLPCKLVLPNVTDCDEGFELINGLCLPSCDWKQITDPWLTILSVIQLLSALLAVISSLVFFVVSGVRYRSIFRYPSIYLVFMTLGFFVVGVLALVGRISPGLFCSTGIIVSTDQSSSPSTIYCTLTGAAFQYFVVGSTIWWFFHVCSIFLKMTVFVTPVYKRLESKIHIGLTVFGFIAPFPAVLNIIARNSSSLRYEVLYFPNLLLCQPNDNDYWFFTTILPIDVLCGIGITLLIVIVRLLHKYQSLLSATPQGSKLQLSVPEIKLLIVFFFYAIFGSYVLFYTAIATEINGDSLVDAIKQYFICEIGGNSTECSEDYSKIKTLSFPYFLFFLLLLLGSVPLMNLMFAINWKYLKVKLLYVQGHVQWGCLKKNNNGSIQQTNKCLNCKAVPNT